MQVYFIDNDDYFQNRLMTVDAEGKEYSDNDERTIFFARGVLETVKTNLVQIAKKACSNLESLASEKQIKINFSSSKKEIFIKGNPGLLEQVITNLIDNSVKYCPDKSIVSCTLSENSGKAKIRPYFSSIVFLSKNIYIIYLQ